MGNSRGAEGLIRNKVNYKRVTFEALNRTRTKNARLKELSTVLRTAKVRMPNKKAGWLVENFDRVTQLGGPELAKAELMKCKGCDEKIQFWRDFRGIGEKYARNIMMDVYHPDFRNTIAVDARIKRISRKLGLTFPNYKEEEWFYLAAAKRAGIEGWELDRMLYGSPALANSRADTLEHSKP